ncbi:dnaJ homolog subfamily C member 4 [Octopus bimaculoides]|uniref:J domain-containing protein n=1 Tax=Octopus bimaculoides TaxID=37653 RepID=A0A0L8H8F6_OCTBM|nr:dnaJ homolog subfamily C member 4 [Octopus bimaculoides]|eukprot:XP_014774589.1 PREDICTED: dnaJ homolog subfamily C member 4-like [Octopus bimaculoides]
MYMIRGPASKLFAAFVQRPSCFHLYTPCWFLHTKRTHYDVLEVDRNASFPEIRSAYILKSKELHPDLNQNDPKNHEKFVRLIEAYNTLSKESTRRDYDYSLATYLHLQKMQRSRGSSHTSASGSHRPGVGFDQSESDERIFWDETIWHMRNKSKDQEFKDRPYYSIKGLRRQPNSYILFGILIWVVVGVFAHYFLINLSRDYSRSVMDQRDIEFHKLYKERRDKALLHGNELQREILMSRYQEENGRNP